MRIKANPTRCQWVTGSFNTKHSRDQGDGRIDVGEDQRAGRTDLANQREEHQEGQGRAHHRQRRHANSTRAEGISAGHVAAAGAAYTSAATPRQAAVSWQRRHVGEVAGRHQRRDRVAGRHQQHLGDGPGATRR